MCCSRRWPRRGPAQATLEGRLELLRTLLTHAAGRMIEDADAPAPSAGELKALATALLNVEKTGQLADQREAAAAARRGAQAARRQGLRPDAVAAIRAAIEGPEAAA